MSGPPIAPRLIRGGIVLVDPPSGQVLRVIPMQYNPDTLTRTIAPQAVSGEGGDRSLALRLKGPPIETIKLDAEIDATDQLEFPDRNPNAVQHGIAPQLAALEALVNPSVAELLSIDTQAFGGTLEIIPPEAPLVLFIWSRNRIAPVRVTEFSVTEEAFDAALNPVRAKVSLGLRVMSTDDLGYQHRGGALFINHLRTRESLAAKTGAATLQSLGIEKLP